MESFSEFVGRVFTQVDKAVHFNSDTEQLEVCFRIVATRIGLHYGSEVMVDRDRLLQGQQVVRIVKTLYLGAYLSTDECADDNPEIRNFSHFERGEYVYCFENVDAMQV